MDSEAKKMGVKMTTSSKFGFFGRFWHDQQETYNKKGKSHGKALLTSFEK